MQPVQPDSANGSMAFASPFISGVMAVQADWIDYNGHLNMAYYNVLFDRCVDQALAPLGLGPDYVKTRNASFFTAEAHVCYLRELHEGMRVRASFQLLDHDEKRIHGFQELLHEEEGWVSATSEIMMLHIDTASKRVTPWPADVLAQLARMQAAHYGLPVNPHVGRVIGIRRKER